MRILHISSGRQFGAIERHIVELCRGLQRKGHEVFAALRPTNEWQDQLEFLPASNILHVSIRNPFGVLSAKKIAAYARKHQIDLIHAHLPRDYFSASLACSLAKSKFILSRHQTGQLKPFNRFALKNLSAAIADSKDIERTLSTLFPPHKLCTIPSGIDIECLKRLDKRALSDEFREVHGIGPDTLLITMIGDLCEEGGQRNFVLAAAEIAKKEPNISFILIGTDPSGAQTYRRDLMRLIEVMELKDKFRFLDHAGDSHGVLAATDVLIPAFCWGYPGREVLEAITFGAAILQSSNGREKSVWGIQDHVIKDPEPLKIAEAIFGLLDTEQRAQYAAQLNEYVRENHSIDSTVSAIEKIYAELK